MPLYIEVLERAMRRSYWQRRAEQRERRTQQIERPDLKPWERRDAMLPSHVETIEATEEELIKMLIPGVEVLPIQEGDVEALVAEIAEGNKLMRAKNKKSQPIVTKMVIFDSAYCTKRLEAVEKLLYKMWAREDLRGSRRMTRLMLYGSAMQLVKKYLELGRVALILEAPTNGDGELVNIARQVEREKEKV